MAPRGRDPATVLEPLGQVAGDVTAAIVGEQTRPVGDDGRVAARCHQGIFKGGCDIGCPHRRAEPPGDDIPAVVIKDG